MAANPLLNILIPVDRGKKHKNNRAVSILSMKNEPFSLNDFNIDKNIDIIIA